MPSPSKKEPRSNPTFDFYNKNIKKRLITIIIHLIIEEILLIKNKKLLNLLKELIKYKQ